MKTPTHAWRKDKPPVGHVVEVWYLTAVLLAHWNGQQWRTADGATFADGIITHWRERA
jgi:hypothetical protein